MTVWEARVTLQRSSSTAAVLQLLFWSTSDLPLSLLVPPMGLKNDVIVREGLTSNVSFGLSSTSSSSSCDDVACFVTFTRVVIWCDCVASCSIEITWLPDRLLEEFSSNTWKLANGTFIYYVCTKHTHTHTHTQKDRWQTDKWFKANWPCSLVYWHMHRWQKFYHTLWVLWQASLC